MKLVEMDIYNDNHAKEIITHIEFTKLEKIL